MGVVSHAAGEFKSRITGFTYEDPETLLANPANWRIHPKAQRDALRGILAEVGYVDAILVNDRTGHVIDGHLRTDDAMATGQKTVPVLHCDLSLEEEQKVLATFDLITTGATSDMDKLKELAHSVETASPALRTLLDAAARLLDAREAPPSADGDEAGEGIAPPLFSVAPGDVFHVTNPTTQTMHKVVCASGTSFGNLAEWFYKDPITCIFTSPPYGIGLDYGETYTDNISSLRKLIADAAGNWLVNVKPGGYAVINFADPATFAATKGIRDADGESGYPMALEYWGPFRGAGWLLWAQRVFCKNRSSVSAIWTASSNRPASDWEHIWTWRKPGGPASTRVGQPTPSAFGWCDILSAEPSGCSKEAHPGQMPAELAYWMISVHSEPGDLVFEPFLGEGTTLIAADRAGRRCIATEINPDYVALTLKRCIDNGLVVTRPNA